MDLDWIGKGPDHVGLFAACSEWVENHSRWDEKPLVLRKRVTKSGI